ncbi:hypothetical protein ACCN59_004799 [Salmonella enterica subsp. enterica]
MVDLRLIILCQVTSTAPAAIAVSFGPIRRAGQPQRHLDLRGEHKWFVKLTEELSAKC